MSFVKKETQTVTTTKEQEQQFTPVASSVPTDKQQVVVQKEVTLPDGSKEIVKETQTVDNGNTWSNHYGDDTESKLEQEKRQRKIEGAPVK